MAEAEGTAGAKAHSGRKLYAVEKLRQAHPPHPQKAGVLYKVLVNIKENEWEGAKCPHKATYVRESIRKPAKFNVLIFN